MHLIYVLLLHISMCLVKIPEQHRKFKYTQQSHRMQSMNINKTFSIFNTFHSFGFSGSNLIDFKSRDMLLSTIKFHQEIEKRRYSYLSKNIPQKSVAKNYAWELFISLYSTYSIFIQKYPTVSFMNQIKSKKKINSKELNDGTIPTKSF